MVRSHEPTYIKRLMADKTPVTATVMVSGVIVGYGTFVDGQVKHVVITDSAGQKHVVEGLHRIEPSGAADHQNLEG